MQDFEKLGAFYLGKQYDAETGKRTDELVLYDSKDLKTHAVIIGMTGSGKTGLGIGLIEEAALDHVPVIAIDPKGDLGNLLLTFPKLAPSDFEPWVDPGAATASGLTKQEFAAKTATTWKKGLADWGQSPERIQKLRDAADLAIYTPGSSAGLPLAVLKEFAVPPVEILEDTDLLQERVQATALGLLTLLGIDADPLTSREHILIANILSTTWLTGQSLELASLIAAVQQPPFDRMGVMDLDSFYPANERFALAMRINNLLAAPGFDVWMHGESLDIDSLLFTEKGKPRVAVMSIAHLDDAQRMFFVTTLLTEVISWMRRQSGSSSLRAILYMDEVFGYLPPVANPPAKRLFLTLLKQARAYGLGLVLATQNPVDLDYKALSNTGTWMIGRLQTDRDKERVRDGLQSASGSGNIDMKNLDATLSGLPKRCFLLHNVHDSKPQLFQTRWAMSYLAGPLTRDQIKRLAATVAKPQPSTVAGTPKPAKATRKASAGRPVLPPAVKQYFFASEASAGSDDSVYAPHLFAQAKLRYSRARLNINEEREFGLLFPATDEAVPIQWDEPREMDLDLDDIVTEPPLDVAFASCPKALSSGKALKSLGAKLKRWLKSERPLVIFKSPALKEYSKVGESERDFRIRLQQLGNEVRDKKVAVLQKRYETKLNRLNERLVRAEQKIASEAEQAKSHKLDTAISFGTAILGAVLGRKMVSSTSATRVGSALKKAGGISRQTADVERARATAGDIRAKIEALSNDFEDDVDALDDAYDAQLDGLTETVIKPTSTEIELRLLGIGWSIDD